MRAAVVSAPGGPDALQWSEVPEPAPAPGEVVVEVRAASINPTDLAARAGMVPDGVRPAYVLGWDFADEIVGTGERVVGMIPWYADGGRRGAYSERVAVPRDWLSPPRGVDLATIGAFGFVIDAVPLGDAVLPAVQDGGRVLVRRALESEAPRGIVREAMLVRPDFEPLSGLIDDVAAGRLRTRIDRRLPMHEAAAAHRLVEDGHPKGKVVLVR